MTRPLALVAALLVTAAACGVAVDDEPRRLHVPETTTTVVAPPSTGRFSTVLYYVSEGDLLPVVRDLPDRTLQSILTALLDPPAESLEGLGTSIPAGTTLLDLQRDRNQIAIDLSASFDNVVGQSRQQAIGQIVLTVTELTDIEVVRFMVEGEPVSVGSPVRGDTPEVTACDFAPMLAGLNEAVERFENVPTAAIVELIDRIDELSDDCPEWNAAGRP